MSEGFGMVMVCPAHRHGTPEEAYEKLRDILGDRLPEEPSAAWICRANQLPTLRKFAPLVDRVAINPFFAGHSNGPTTESVVWRNFDHGIVNRARAIREAAQGAALFACIDLYGETHYFADRRPSYEEIEWLTYVAVGANFQGIVWRRSRQSVPFARRLDILERRLDRYAVDLGRATPVTWVESPSGHPVSAVRSGEHLFVVLLSREYLLTNDGREGVPLPLELPETQAEVRIRLPAGRAVRSCLRLCGSAAPLSAEVREVRVSCRIEGAGEILVFRLGRRGTVSPDKRDE
jgi:hypothetical protein